jgi:hypothetical protein
VDPSRRGSSGRLGVGGYRIYVAYSNPEAQLSFTDLDGHRFQCFITDQEDPDTPPWRSFTASMPRARSAFTSVSGGRDGALSPLDLRPIDGHVAATLHPV